MAHKQSKWAALSGFASAIAENMKSNNDFEQKKKLYAMEQDVMQKREETLAALRANLQDQNASNRSDRAMGRMGYQHQLQSGDIVGQFKDPETGSFYGRTKSGDVVPLNITSDEYQAAQKKYFNGRADAEAELPAQRQAQIDHTEASTANINDQIVNRDKPKAPKDISQDIRKDYGTQIKQLHDEDMKKAALAQKAGTDYTPMDPLTMRETARANLYDTYGADKVNGALGAVNNKPATPAPTPTPAAAPSPPPASQQTSPTQPSAPSMQQIMDEASAAVKKRPDLRDQIEAKMTSMMQQFGYAPAPPDESDQ